MTWEELEPRKARIVHEARRLMSRDLGYVGAISSSTGDVERVRIRFDRARTVLRAVLP